LTALIPESGFGTTLAEYPTLLIYVPDIDLNELEIKFELYTDGYKTQHSEDIVIKNGDRIVIIDFSKLSSLPPLEYNKIYQWQFSLYNKQDEYGESIGGIIERIKPNSEIKHKLNTASLQELPAIYADNGVWYDSIASLAKLRCLDPNNLDVASNWRSLLQLERLQGDIYKKPLEQCNLK
jgi:hypothetical protein